MKPLIRVWEFASSSSRGTNYETLMYSDLTTSCNCMGWTRRTQPDGSRSCKHTRLVDMLRADAECVASHDYRTDFGRSPLPTPTPPPTPFGTTRRKLQLA